MKADNSLGVRFDAIRQLLQNVIIGVASLCLLSIFEEVIKLSRIDEWANSAVKNIHTIAEKSIFGIMLIFSILQLLRIGRDLLPLKSHEKHNPPLEQKDTSSKITEKERVILKEVIRRLTSPPDSRLAITAHAESLKENFENETHFCLPENDQTAAFEEYVKKTGTVHIRGNFSHGALPPSFFGESHAETGQYNTL